MDQIALERIIHDYADAIDEGDFGTIARLFADGRLVLHERDEAEPIVLDGADAVVTFLTEVAKIPSGPARTRHLVSNIKTDIDGDHAVAVATFVVFLLDPGQSNQPATVGRYCWSFRRSGDGWAIGTLDIFAEYRSA